MTNDFIILPNQQITRPMFQQLVNERIDEFQHHQKVLVKSANLPLILSCLEAARNLNISLYLCPPSVHESSLHIEKWGISLYIGEKTTQLPAANKDQTPRLGIFTSATMGEPKIALHRWDAIESSSHFVPKALQNQTWLLSYAPWSYAGLQVFFSALNNKGALYYGENHFEQISRDMVKYGVSIASATPTFWRMLIAAWPPKASKPKLLQATLGGEIVDQAIIDLVENFFHPENLTHIYASTESGSAIVVSDRKAGFPAEFLKKKTKNGTEIRISNNGELEVLSPVGMDRYLERAASKDKWISTGDLVEQKEDRVYFIGRKDGRINTGGRKVSPEEVEQALNALEGVEDSLVYEKKSPIVGALIVADVISSTQDFDPAAIKEQLKKQLENYKIPHIIRRVDHFAISSTGKKIRKP